MLGPKWRRLRCDAVSTTSRYPSTRPQSVERVGHEQRPMTYWLILPDAVRSMPLLGTRTSDRMSSSEHAAAIAPNTK